jgi:hypothetical protein
MNKKDIVNSAMSLAERSHWTVLDEKLYFLEELSDRQILEEAIQKMYSLTNVPANTKNICLYVGEYIKNTPKKMSREDRYILSVFLAYNSEEDLKKKS